MLFFPQRILQFFCICHPHDGPQTLLIKTFLIDHILPNFWPLLLGHAPLFVALLSHLCMLCMSTLSTQRIKACKAFNAIYVDIVDTKDIQIFCS